jgi:hypothetical protein
MSGGIRRRDYWRTNMSKKSDFRPTMLAFLQWFLRTLDREFTEPLLAGRTLEDAAEQVFDDIAANVRGNRDSDVTLTATDYGAIMDRIAALHIRTRHGEEAVSETSIP